MYINSTKQNAHKYFDSMNHHYYTSQIFALSKLDFTIMSREERERKDREKDR